MRKNVELKKEWQKAIRYCDEYQITIFMMNVVDNLELTVALDLDGVKMSDYECVMCLEDTDEPTSEMKKKFKSLVKYFSQHFENVQGETKVIIV